MITPVRERTAKVLPIRLLGGPSLAQMHFAWGHGMGAEQFKRVRNKTKRQKHAERRLRMIRKRRRGWA